MIQELRAPKNSNTIVQMYIGHSAAADAQHLELPDGVSKAQLHIDHSFSAVFPTGRYPVPYLLCPNWFPILLPAERQIVTNKNLVVLKYSKVPC